MHDSHCFNCLCLHLNVHDVGNKAIDDYMKQSVPHQVLINSNFRAHVNYIHVVHVLTCLCMAASSACH